MKLVLASLTFLALVACAQPKPKAEKQYQLTGKIISIDTKDHTASVDAAAIPNFMGAMTMDYPIASDSDLSALKVGENITATVNVKDDGSYNLSNIRPRPSSDAGK